MELSKAKYEVVYNGKNITTDILPHVTSFTYSDKTHGEADELELVMEDTSEKWANDWFPAKGDIVSAKIIQLGRVLDCGIFTVDQITGSGSKEAGDIVSIKAISAGVNVKLRSKQSYAHENKTLREIANTVAVKHGLKVVGKIEDITIGRITQYDETDLKFLHRLASEYGYYFSIRGAQLVFTDILDIESSDSVFTIKKSDCITWEITDQNAKTYKGVKVRHKSHKKKDPISFDGEDNEDFEPYREDILLLKSRSENKKQAERKGKTALHKHNTAGKEGRVSIPGNIFAVAGINADIIEIGNFSGKYYIETSTHEVNKDGGYITDIGIKKTAKVDPKKFKK
jgi:phage protein D